MPASILEKLKKAEQELGAPEGLLQRQIAAESSFNPLAVSDAGAQGLAQMLPSTTASLSKRVGRNLDPFNEDDALLMQRMVMQENYQKFGSWEAAAAAYHGGWNKDAWGDKTKAYVNKLFNNSPEAQAAFAKEYAKRTQGINKYIPELPELRSRYDWDKLGDELYREYRDNSTAYSEFWAGVGGTVRESIAGGIGLTAATLQLAVDPIFKPAVGEWRKDKDLMQDFTASEYEWADDSQSPEEYAFRINKIQVRRMAAQQMAKYSGGAQLLGGIVADPIGGYGVGRAVSLAMRGFGVGASAYARTGQTASAVASSAVENAVGSAIAVGIEDHMTGQVTAADAWINILTGTIVGVGGEAAFGGFRKAPEVRDALDRVTARAEESVARDITGQVVREDTAETTPVRTTPESVQVAVTPEQAVRSVEDAVANMPTGTTTVEQVAKDTGVAVDVVERTITEAAAKLGVSVEHGLIAKPGADKVRAASGLAATLSKLAEDQATARAQGLTSLAEALRKRAQQVEAEDVRKAEAEKLDALRALRDKLNGASGKKADDAAKQRAVQQLIKTLERRQNDLGRIAREEALQKVADEEAAKLRAAAQKKKDEAAEAKRKLAEERRAVLAAKREAATTDKQAAKASKKEQAAKEKAEAKAAATAAKAQAAADRAATKAQAAADKAASHRSRVLDTVRRLEKDSEKARANAESNARVMADQERAAARQAQLKAVVAANGEVSYALHEAQEDARSAASPVSNVADARPGVNGTARNQDSTPAQPTEPRMPATRPVGGTAAKPLDVKLDARKGKLLAEQRARNEQLLREQDEVVQYNIDTISRVLGTHPDVSIIRDRIHAARTLQAEYMRVYGTPAYKDAFVAWSDNAHALSLAVARHFGPDVATQVRNGEKMRVGKIGDPTDPILTGASDKDAMLARFPEWARSSLAGMTDWLYKVYSDARTKPNVEDKYARAAAKARMLAAQDGDLPVTGGGKHSVTCLFDKAAVFENVAEQAELIEALAATYAPDIPIAIRLDHAEEPPSAYRRELNGELVFVISLPNKQYKSTKEALWNATHEFGHVVGYSILHGLNSTELHGLGQAFAAWAEYAQQHPSLEALRSRMSDAGIDVVNEKYAGVAQVDARVAEDILTGRGQWRLDYVYNIDEVFAEQFVNVVTDTLAPHGITLGSGILDKLRKLVIGVLKPLLAITTRGKVHAEVHALLTKLAAGSLRQLNATELVGMPALRGANQWVVQKVASGNNVAGGRMDITATRVFSPDVPAYNLPLWTPITQPNQLGPEDFGLHRLPHYDLAVKDPSQYTPEEAERAMHAAQDIAAIKAKLVTMQRAVEPGAAWNQPDLKERIDGWLTRAPYLTSAAVSMLRSRSPIMRYAAWNLFEKTTTQGAPTATMRAHLEYNKITGSYVNEDNAAYREWLKAKGVRLRDRAMDYLFGGNKLRDEFNRAVRLELAERAKASLGPQIMRNVDPTVKKAADLVGALSTRLRDSQVANETPGWESLIGLDSTTYVPQKLSPGALVDATEAEMAGLAQVLKDQLAQTTEKQKFTIVNGKRVLVTTGPNKQPVMVPWDSDFIDEFVARYLQRARSRAIGGSSTSFDLNSGGALDDVDDILHEFPSLTTQERYVLRGLFDGSNSSHTKHRLRLDMTAPVPGTGKRLLDFYDNNYARLLDQQARRVAADVGCVSVGIGGRAGIQSIHAMLKEQGSAEAGTNVTEGELLRFEQAVAELYGEPFGNVRSVAVNVGMLATSLVRMGGSSVAQVAETVNLAQHLGLTTLLREVSSFNRIRKEAIALANGKPLPAGADPALRSVELVGGFDYGTTGYKHNVPWFDRDNDMVPAVANSVIERVLRDSVDWMYKVNLFRAIHAVQQRFVAGELNSKYIRHMSGDKAFRTHELGFAERAGLTQAFIDRMKADPGWKKVVVRNSEVVNFDLADFHPDIGVEYAGILRRQVGVVIQEAFAGERAPYLHNDIGRMFMQFQNYSVLAHEKQLKATLESHGWAMSATIMMAQMLALAPAYMLRVQMNAIGMPEEEKERYLKEALSPAKIAVGAMNLSSMAGLYPNIFGIAVNQFGPFARDTWAEPYVNPMLAKQGQLFFGGIGAPSVKMANDWYKVFQPDGKEGVHWQDIARNSFMATLPGYRNIINTLPNGEEN